MSKQEWIPHRRETWPFRYATLLKDIDWAGSYKAGQTVKIVMVSRFGDVGITGQLDAEYGYNARVPIDRMDEFFGNRRSAP